MKFLKGERFEFGANWARFHKLLNDESIRIAEESLKLDVASGKLQG